MSSFHDSLAEYRPTGVFVLRGIDKQGNEVFRYEDHNLVVDASKALMARLLSDATATSKVISKIGLGTGALPPAAGDTALTSPFVKAMDSVAYPAANKVTFNWSLGYGEGNGVTYTEYGLLSGDNTLFARKTRGGITKADDLALSGSWTIVF